jgi:hypothetical protein
MSNNAFNWRGEPSVFTKRGEVNVNQFNGVHEDKSTRMTQMEKKHITYAKGDFLNQPKTQVNVYGKAK